MTTIDLNADLGESYGPWVMGADAAMLDIVTSANVACGGHAGDADTMVETLNIAAQKGVCVGAHPGFEDKQGFGRRRLPLTVQEVERLVAGQVGTLKGLSGFTNAKVHYVKAHGALSNWAAEVADIAEAIARAIKSCHPDCALLAVSGTELEKAGHKFGLNTFSEIFADRAYGDDGNLVSRSQPGSVITDADAASQRLIQFFETGKMPTASGGTVALEAHSICIHGDNPHAVDMGKSIKAKLSAQGMVFKPFCAN